jgi:tRNA pseudouridine32 synthase/23S rRNA pseudouridine746 synthase
MSTSGVMLIAKTKEVHQQLQSQFSNRKITKRYIALIKGTPKDKKGTISLPLRVDLDNRPCQLVCFQFGKTAKTDWELDYSQEEWSRIVLYPHQGRTHQLRVHCAHPLGLNAPILGDDLYNDLRKNGSDNLPRRLYLHAEYLEFIHPITGRQMKIEAPCTF